MGFFNSPVQDAIEKATDEELRDVDWSANLAICDLINRDAEGPKDAIKTLRKRIGNSHPLVVHLALTLFDTCLKNCKEEFHRLAGAKDTQEVLLERIQSKKTRGEVRAEMMRFLEQWAESLKDTPHGGAFWDTYERLRLSGMEFPTRPSDAPNVPYLTPAAHGGAPPPPNAGGARVPGGPAPVLGDRGSYNPATSPGASLLPCDAPPASYAPAPSGSYGMAPPTHAHNAAAMPYMQQGRGNPYQQQQLQYQQQQQQQQQQYQQHPHQYAQHAPPPQQAGPQHVSGQQARRKLKDDIAIVRESVNILAESLNAVNPITESVAQNELITEFAMSCKQMRPRVMSLIESLEDEEILADLLVVIDHLNRVLEAHEAACRREPIAHQPLCPAPSDVGPAQPLPEQQQHQQQQQFDLLNMSSQQPAPQVQFQAVHAIPVDQGDLANVHVAIEATAQDMREVGVHDPLQGGASSNSSSSGAAAPAARKKPQQAAKLPPPPAAGSNPRAPRRLPPLEEQQAAAQHAPHASAAPAVDLLSDLGYSAAPAAAQAHPLAGGAAWSQPASSAPPAAATPAASSAPTDNDDDGFAALARRRTATADKSPPDGAASRLAPPPATSAAGPSSPTHSDTVPILGGGGPTAIARPAAAVRQKKQEYMEMKADQMYDL